MASSKAKALSYLSGDLSVTDGVVTIDESVVFSPSYLEHSDTISDSFTIASGINRMYIGGTTFSGTITVAGRLAVVAGPANFTGTINISNTGTLSTV